MNKLEERMCAYVTEPLVVEPFVISVFYHLRDQCQLVKSWSCS